MKHRLAIKKNTVLDQVVDSTKGRYTAAPYKSVSTTFNSKPTFIDLTIHIPVGFAMITMVPMLKQKNNI